MIPLDAMVARFCRLRPAIQRLALVLVAAAMFLPALASLPVTDRDEARFVQASRQMVETGDLIDIRFQDESRYKKPVGIYWLQALAMTATGGGAEASVWVSRLPSYLGAIAAVALVQVVGLPLVGATPAGLAALLFAGTLVLAGEARIAKTDAVLLALILGAMAVLSRLYMRRSLPRWQVYAFWACLGLAALVKGPVGPLVVGLTVLALSLWNRDRQWLAPLGNLRAVALGLAVVLPWLVAISFRAGAEFWTASVGADLMAKVASGQEGKGAPPGTYLGLVWITFWPASLLLAVMLPSIWSMRNAPAQRFLLAWLLPTWGVFELVPTKLIHYPLPLYPALSLLAVGAWFARAPGPPGRVGRALAVVFLAIGPLLLGAALWLALTTGATGGLWPALVALPLAVVLGIGIWRGLGQDLRFVTPVALALLGAVTLAGALGTLARTPWLWPSDALAVAMRDAAPATCPATRLIATGYTEPSLIVRTSRFTALLSVDAAAAEAAKGCALIAVEDRSAKDFAALTPTLAQTRIARIDGFALGAGRKVGITLYQFGAEP